MTSGPITVIIKEGMVTVGAHTYSDTHRMRIRPWPRWVTQTLDRVERDHERRMKREYL